MNNQPHQNEANDDLNQDLFDELAEQFTAECRDGSEPVIEDYATQNPELADQIREFFPTIEAIERFGRVDDSQKRFQQAQAKFDIQRPTSIGEYKIVREIGRGGMGIVYEAIQQSLDRPIAIKILLRTSNEAKQILRFEREAATAARLHHTNIVPVFGVGNQGQYHYYVMQLIDGVGFDQVVVALKNPSVAVPHPQLTKIAQWLPDVDALHNGRYYRSVAKIARSLANALSYAHQQGTLHRDIKPANLLIDTKGHVWLADFGLAKAIESQDVSRTGDVVGTLKYMSPEQFAGTPDHRSDIYGLGLTIYELLTLQSAYNDSSRSHLVFDRNKKQSPPKSPSKLVRHLPKDLETIVMKACALDPELRYQTAADLETDLDNFLLDRPIAARPPSAFENFHKWCRRNPAVAALSSLAFALLMVIAALSSVAYIRANAALGKETEQRMLLEIEKSRSEALRSKTKNTLDISLAALDKIFQRLTPETSEANLVSTVEDSDGQQITLQVDPIISTQTASLLEEMLLVYDRLAKQDADDPRLKADSADAIAHVGKIHEQLGAHDKAAASLQLAIQRYQSIDGKEFEAAKLHNVLGNILRNQQNHAEAEKSFETSIELLNDLLSQQSSDGTPDTKVKVELARSHCLLAKHQPDAYEHRPPPNLTGLLGSMLGRGGPPQSQHRRSSDQQQHLRTAKEMLLELIDADPASPEVRFLLALCYRDSRGGDGGSQRNDAIETLRALAEDFPRNNEFQFALAEILASPEHRFFGADDHLAKLDESIAILEKLTARNPKIPRFLRLHAQAAHRRGMDQMHKINKPDEPETIQAIHFLKRGKEIQNQLALEFPDSFELKYWLAKMTGGYAEGLILLERYDDAFDELTTATSIAEELSEDETARVPALHLLIQLQRELASVHRKRGEASQARAAMDRLEEYRRRMPRPPRR